MANFSSKFRNTELNAGSMADVAFLLLIFFLVVTTIDVDKGIAVQLPPWCETDCASDVNKDRVLSIKVNSLNQLLVRGDEIRLAELTQRTKEFIMNPDRRKDYPDDPKQAIISIQNDRSTNYAAYLGVYNEVKAAYNQLWESESQRRFGASYDALSNSLKKTIRTDIPLIISEAEPTDYALAN